MPGRNIYLGPAADDCKKTATNISHSRRDCRTKRSRVGGIGSRQPESSRIQLRFPSLRQVHPLLCRSCKISRLGRSEQQPCAWKTPGKALENNVKYSSNCKHMKPQQSTANVLAFICAGMPNPNPDPPARHTRTQAESLACDYFNPQPPCCTLMSCASEYIASPSTNQTRYLQRMSWGPQTR